jgi:tetratricopeptide (TPR) repeat protein
LAYANKGRYDEAISAFTEAIDIDQNFAAAYEQRGVAYINKHFLDKAIADETMTISLVPDDSIAYYVRGICHEELGQRDAAIAGYREALKANLNPADTTDTRARLKRLGAP